MPHLAIRQLHAARHRTLRRFSLMSADAIWTLIVDVWVGVLIGMSCEVVCA
jgi:hypothetical protein